MSVLEAGSEDQEGALVGPFPVEDGVRHVVRALNVGRSVSTIGSCAGHAWGGRAPYVYFICPVPVAAAIERTLRDAWASGSSLHAYWTVQGVFNETGALCFTLFAPRLNDLAADPFRSWFVLGVGRRRVDEDLRTISKLLQEVLAQFEHYDFLQPGNPDVTGH